GEKRVRAGSEEFAVENPEGNLMTYSNWNDEGYEWNDGAEKEWISAPSVPLALKWFRDEKNLKNEVRFYYCSDSYETYYYQGFLDCKNYKQLLSTPHFDTYEAAESALLDELLTVLEKEKG
ncbi:MAG: hypothetical protein LBK58_05405, partial [Prevotellaceae bacterium]|nr:hypothetical protein [Prevotellaceae bacterium]